MVKRKREKNRVEEFCLKKNLFAIMRNHRFISAGELTDNSCYHQYFDYADIARSLDQ